MVADCRNEPLVDMKCSGRFSLAREGSLLPGLHIRCNYGTRVVTRHCDNTISRRCLVVFTRSHFLEIGHDVVVARVVEVTNVHACQRPASVSLSPDAPVQQLLLEVAVARVFVFAAEMSLPVSGVEAAVTINLPSSEVTGRC